MYNLIKLEKKKFKFHFLAKGAILADLIILAFLLFTVYIGIQENDPMCNNTEEWIVTVNVFTLLTFIIYGGTVLAKLIISEYRTKTIQLMFMYPIDRRKLLLSKTIMVYLFTAMHILIGNIIILAGIMITDHFYEIVPGGFDYSALIDGLPICLLSIICGGFLAIVPLFFGMRKKSTTHTIVAAVIVACLTSSGMGNMSLSAFLVRILIVGGVAVISFILTITHALNNVDNIDME